MSDVHKIERIQEILGGIPVDGIWGKRTQAALDAVLSQETASGWHVGKGSSFADPADIRAFKRCKAAGGTDQECFKVGDNGIGRWGTDTTQNIPMCALPPEDWMPLAKPNGSPVFVEFNDQVVCCELQDTMPRKANITNGAIIDLNEAAWRALGKTPPVMENVRWRWA